MRKKWKSILGLAISASLILSGCNGLFGSNASSGDPLAKEQVLRMTETSEISTLDTAKLTDVVSMGVASNVLEGLYRNGRGKAPEKGVVQSFKLSADKKTYTFKLRQDAAWSDGKPVTAHDFEYAWKRALNPATKSSYSYVFYSIVNAMEYNQGKKVNGKNVTADQVGVIAQDDQTLVVKLKQPLLNFLNLTTLPVFYPQRQDIVEKYKDKYGLKADTLVYNGPFVVKEWSTSKLHLEKNEHYWDKNTVNLTAVDLNIVKEMTTGVNLFNAGQVDVALLNESIVDLYNRTPEYLAVEQATTYYLQFNLKDKFFQNANIRKAISLAIDRNEITSNIMKDGSKPAGSLIPPSLNNGSNQSFRPQKDGKYVEVVTPDIKRAQELFQKGLEELKLSAPPNGYELISSDNSAAKNISVYLKERFRVVFKWEIRTNPMPLKNRLANMEKGNYQMAIAGWGADYNDPISHFETFQSNSPFNYSKFNNKEYDALVNKAKKEIDAKKQYEALLKAEKLLVGVDGGEAIIAPLYYKGSSYVQKLYVKDLYRHPVGAPYSLKWAYISKDKK